MSSHSSAASAILEGSDGEHLTLEKVEIEGQLTELLFKVRARQYYKNQTGENIETVYTFPLPWGASLLGLAVTIGGKSWNGIVIEKNQAQQNYEKAIDDGDTPVMVEKSGDGLYTAHMGNLKQGEEAVIEIEYAQLLRFDQDTIRIAIPTSVAPRYGDPVQTGGLASPASVEADERAAYPLTLKLQLQGAVSKGSLSCPSHNASFAANPSGTDVILNHNAMLDRDFVLNIEGLQAQSFATVAQDGEEFAVLASFCPDFPAAAPKAIDLKILVDCSGSMDGDSIQQARQGLREVCQLMSVPDRVSYSKFGSDTDPVIPALTACTPAFVTKTLMQAIDATEADMGGTELHDALLNTFDISKNRNEILGTDILLITDGDVWDIRRIIESAQASRHRIFAIGVGSAPAESLLQDLAELTGGACELVTPNEDIASAIVRMVTRMRTAQAADIAIAWHGKTRWTSPMPKQIYPGETVHAFALMSARPDKAPVISVSGSSTGKTAAHCLNTCSQNVLARLCGARRMKTVATEEEASALALQYQLVSEHTSLFMVAERAADEKAKGLPRLTQIGQMQTAGWGGFGTVSNLITYDRLDRNGICFMRKTAGGPAGNGSAKLAAFLRGDDDISAGISPAGLVDLLEDMAPKIVLFEEGLIHFLRADVTDEISDLLAAIEDETGSQSLAWAFFMDWIASSLVSEIKLSRHAARILRQTLLRLEKETGTGLSEWLKAKLPGLKKESWGVIIPGDFKREDGTLESA